MARAKPSPRTQPVAEFSRAVRTSTKVRTQRVAQEQNAWEKLKKGRRRGKRRKARVFSQAELMAEARVTEFHNARSLKEMLAREEKKKKVVIKKKKIVGAFMRYHSTRRSRTFTFVGSPCEAIVAFPKETQSEPYPSSTKCAITGQPAKYFDPRTREPFATADAFRQLRCMADEGRVPAFKQHGARSLIVCLRLPAGWRSRLPVRVRKSVVKSEPVYFSQQPVSSQQPASSQQPMSSQQPVSSQQPLIDDGVPRWRVVGVGCDDFLRYTIRLRRVLPMFVPVPPVSHPVASRQGIFGTDNFGPLPSSTGMGSPAQQLLLPPLANFMKPLPIPNFSLNSMMNAGSTDLPPPPMVGRQYTKRSNVTESGLLTLVPGHRMGHQANNIPVSQGLSHNKSAPRHHMVSQVHHPPALGPRHHMSLTAPGHHMTASGHNMAAQVHHMTAQGHHPPAPAPRQHMTAQGHLPPAPSTRHHMIAQGHLPPAPAPRRHMAAQGHHPPDPAPRQHMTAQGHLPPAPAPRHHMTAQGHHPPAPASRHRMTDQGHRLSAPGHLPVARNRFSAPPVFTPHGRGKSHKQSTGHGLSIPDNIAKQISQINGSHLHKFSQPRPEPRLRKVPALPSTLSQFKANVSAGLQQSGLQPSGISLQQSGLQPSGIGFQQNNIGLEQGGTGSQRRGIGIQQSGAGLQYSGIGLQQNIIGLKQGGLNIQRSGIGVQQNHIGLQHSGIGLQQGNIGLQQSDIGLQRSGIGLQQSDIGLQRSGIGLQQSDIGLQRSEIGLKESSVSSQQGRIDLEQTNFGPLPPSISNPSLGVSQQINNLGLHSNNFRQIDPHPNRSGVQQSNVSGVHHGAIGLKQHNVANTHQPGVSLQLNSQFPSLNAPQTNSGIPRYSTPQFSAMNLDTGMIPPNLLDGLELPVSFLQPRQDIPGLEPTDPR
eukprot:217015_1